MNTRLQLEEKWSICFFSILTFYDVVFLVFFNQILIHMLLSDCASNYGPIRRTDIMTPWWWHTGSSETPRRMCVYRVHIWAQVSLVGWNEFCIIPRTCSRKLICLEHNNCNSDFMVYFTKLWVTQSVQSWTVECLMNDKLEASRMAWLWCNWDIIPTLVYGTKKITIETSVKLSITRL